MTKDNQKSLPPVIRVFLSSTFADMDKERSYFNEVLAPKLSRMCAERGVSFFSVDLRWGITEEEQIDGKVLPICLSEIDKCRPYFIGILGNRYGSILQNVPEKISNIIPWLAGKEGRSITELEMLYAVLEHNDEETVSNSAFYFRSDELTKQLYGDIKQEDALALENLRRLKQCIEEDDDTPCSRYSSIEEFGSFVMRDILNWLDKHFPESEDIDSIRCEWYNSEILRNHVENTELNAFFNAYVDGSKKPLLICGDGARGKTASLTAWTPTNAHKILVNCGADDKFLYWPSIVEEIVKQLAQIAEEIGDSEALDKISSFNNNYIEKNKTSVEDSNCNIQKSLFFFMESSLEKFRTKFIPWLSELKLEEKVVIVINDLNLIEGERSKLLCWLPSNFEGNLNLICSTNDDEMVGNADVLGWNIKEMPLLSKTRAERFITDFLRSYGKNLSALQFDRILHSAPAQYPGLLRFIVRFLINHGRFENLDELIDSISKPENIQEVYHFIYAYLMNSYSPNEQKIARTVLGLVRTSRISLNERECFELVGKLVDITPIEWANVCRALEQFEIIQGDYWHVRNEEIQKFVDSLLSEQELSLAHETLGDYVMEKLTTKSDCQNELSARNATGYSKVALIHYQQSRSWEKLFDVLFNDKILSYLYLVDWEYVRASLMQIFLHTDFDIVDGISKSAQFYLSKTEYYNPKIGKMLLGLLADFEYNTELAIICKKLKMDVPHGTIDSNGSGVSSEFIAVYSKMRQLQNREQHRKAYEYIQKQLSLNNGFSEMERCQLLFAKGNIEMRLAYYSDALETVNEYYRLALKMGFSFEMRRALSMRGSVLYRMDRYDEARQIMDRTIAFALSEGEIRSYLGALNMVAMLNYHTGKYDESIEIFNDIYKYWCKIGDIREVCATVLNKCNALSYKDEYGEALKLAEEWYHLIKRDSSMTYVSTTLLGNMGYYAYECGDYDDAEKYLLNTVDITKKLGFESSRLKAYFALINLYDKTDNFGKKLAVYKEKLEFLFERGQYEDLIKDLKKVVEQLLIYKHKRQATELENYWRRKFTTIEGGRDYFDNQIKSESLDSVSLDALEEQLVIARSEADTSKIAHCHLNLAEALKATDNYAAIEHYLSAIDAFFAIKNKAEALKCAGAAISLLFNRGVLENRELAERIMKKTSDEAFSSIVALWESVGTDKGVDVYSALLKIVSTDDEYASVASMALCDLGYDAVDACSAEELIELANIIREKSSSVSVIVRWEEIILEDLHKNEAKLIKDYMSPEAERLIARIEKSIVFLNVFDKSNAATLAGNIAIIFRRRGDKEKTLYYHGLSMEIFKELKKYRDQFIEMTNLATAYHTFGEDDKAIDLLREALQIATEVGDEQQRALIADNLADFLRMRNNPDDKDEILSCFDIGESFFRSAGFARDLIISLRNQVIYLCDKEPIEVWEPKLKEVAKLVRENGFSEFEGDIEKLEWFAYRQSGARNSLEIDEVRERIESIANEDFAGAKIHGAEELDEFYKFFALPNEQTGGREELFYFYEINAGNTIHLVTAYVPVIPAENLEMLEEYISWWNKLGDYTLKWEKDNKYLSAHAIFRASDWDGISSQHKRFVPLWFLDKTALLAIFSGACELSEIQGAKLNLMNI